jgi:hypothetical protein
MMRQVVLVAIAVGLVGCVSTKTVPIESSQLDKLHGGTIVISKRGKGDFAAMTAGKAAFGLLGVAAMISAGNKIIAENNVEDPAGYIGGKLASNFAAAHSLTVAEAGDVLSTGTDIKQLAAQHSKADLLLDVQTVNWSFIYFPTDFNNYRVIYTAKLRLVDIKRGKLMAEGFCKRIPDKTVDAPSKDELLADGAARLKKELMIAADFCVGDFGAKVLSIH